MTESNDSFVITTRTSWISRVGKSFAGIIVGVILIPVSIVLLSWNEGRTAHTTAALTEGRKQVIAVNATSVDKDNDKKLVYLAGPVSAEEILSDDLFGVSQNALILTRDVKVFQWKETKKSTSDKNLGGSETTTTKYSYDKVWSDSLIDSNDFEKEEGHSNPKSQRVSSQTYIAADAKLGDFHISESLIEQIDGAKPLVIKEEDIAESEDESEDKVLFDGGLYLGDNAKNPQIGDVMIRYTYVEPTTVSIVAGQMGDSLEAFASSNGTPIALVKSGKHSAESLFQSALEENSVMAWLLRLAGLVCCITGFALILSPLAVLADVIPMVGSLVGAGTGLVSFVLGLCVSVVTIAIAWFAYRPVAAILLLSACALIVYFVYRRKRNPQIQST